MKTAFLRSWPILLLLAVLGYPRPAMAYIGPGSGLSAIGAVLAVVLGLLLAVFGFIWFPLKRLFRALRRRRNPEEDEDEEKKKSESDTTGDDSSTNSD